MLVLIFEFFLAALNVKFALFQSRGGADESRRPGCGCSEPSVLLWELTGIVKLFSEPVMMRNSTPGSSFFSPLIS